MMGDMERSHGFETYFEISNRESSESGVYPRSFGLDGWVDGSSIYGCCSGGGMWVVISSLLAILSLKSLLDVQEEMSYGSFLYENESLENSWTSS